MKDTTIKVRLIGFYDQSIRISRNYKGKHQLTAIGVGHVADEIEKIGFLLSMPVVKIC